MRLALVALLASLFAGCAGCGGATKTATTPSSHVEAKKIEGPKGAPLAMACTPSGPEMCFNAVDDNCNGVIDEGCGVGTGVLQFTIAWSEGAADVDLAVTDPRGATVDRLRRQAASGMRLDRACPASGDEDPCSGQNVENAYFEGVDPPRGTYSVEVRLKDAHGAPTPIHVSFSARVGSRTTATEITLPTADGAASATVRLEL